MIHPGDVVREADRRQKELDRELAQHQARVDTLRPVPRYRPGFRDAYYRRLAEIGRLACRLGLALGCSLEARALTNRRAMVKVPR